MSTSIRDQLYGVRRKMRSNKRKTIVLPSGLTFNRSGTKYFDQVLEVLDWSLKDIPVEIDFTNCSSANYQAASLLILYCWRLKAQGCEISFKLNDDYDANGSRVWRMLGAQGLFAVSTDPTTNFKFKEHKPLIAIRNSDDFQSALREVDTFTAQFGIEYQKTLRYVISELLYNVLEHGPSDFLWRGHRYPTPGLIQFTWYEKMNELHFIVADTGVGVKQHLSQAYPAIANHEEALRLAIQPEISGTFGRQDPYANRNNAGMGLFLSSNIIRKLRADMYLVSGNAVMHVSPMDNTAKSLATHWPGTFALLTIRVDKGTEFELDTAMNDLRAQARVEVKARTDANAENRYYLHVYNYFGKYADNKEDGIKHRDKHLIPAVDEGKTLLIDFQDVLSSTHSFLNALLASPIRRMGLRAYKRIRIIIESALLNLNFTQMFVYLFDDNNGPSNDGTYGYEIAVARRAA